MDKLVPGVTNSKKHFNITLQHINTWVKSAFWQRHQVSLQAPAFLHITLFTACSGPGAGGVLAAGPGSPVPLHLRCSGCTPVICLLRLVKDRSSGVRPAKKGCSRASGPV